MMKGIDLGEVKNLSDGEKRYEALMDMMPVMQKYNTFTMAKNIGIVFGPTDITYEELRYFHCIMEVITPKENSNGK